MLYRLHQYFLLTRMHKPVGTVLLVWPVLWALWLAADGIPPLDITLIFLAGTFLMRSAGCAINDFADRKIDAHVKRTEQRPLATGAIQSWEAVLVFLVLSLCAFGLVLLTNTLTVMLSFVALAIAFAYPFMKRHTHLPQVVLGAAFTFGVPMVFAAVLGEVPPATWVLYLAGVVWTVIYDTYYAMVDRDDDLRIGVKSTAVLFGEHDRLIIAMLQLLALALWFTAGQLFGLGLGFQIGLLLAALLFFREQLMIRDRDRDLCFQAFLHSQLVGMVVFFGIALDFVFRG